MKEKIKYIRWFDLLLITGVMFGYMIYSSTLWFVASLNTSAQEAVTYTENYSYSAAENYLGLALQCAYLAVVFVYLKWRRFDFSQWRIKITPRAILTGIVLFAAASLCNDAIGYGVEGLTNLGASPAPLYGFFANETVSTVIYAILNGFYEEIYFIGICLSVQPKFRIPAFLFSLVIRFSFHTYQGLASAFGIAFVLGVGYFIYIVKAKDKNLFPIFFSHTIADVTGLGLVYYIYRSMP